MSVCMIVCVHVRLCLQLYTREGVCVCVMMLCVCACGGVCICVCDGVSDRGCVCVV